MVAPDYNAAKEGVINAMGARPFDHIGWYPLQNCHGICT